MLEFDKNAQLSRFHLGRVDDGERLSVERLLLEDPEALLDFFEVKRALEGAAAVPSKPSRALWARLAAGVRENPKRAAISLSLGFACAASLAIAWILMRPTAGPGPSASPAHNRILFDSPGELSGGQAVL